MFYLKFEFTSVSHILPAESGTSVPGAPHEPGAQPDWLDSYLVTLIPKGGGEEELLILSSFLGSGE